VIKEKGKKERLVPISQRGYEWLAFYIGKIRPMFAFIGSGKPCFWLIMLNAMYRVNYLTWLQSI
jgi:site-specific recombinase XerD